MPRYVAFLRGVSPSNAKMPELQACFQAAGFTDVRTVLSSGNVVFDADASVPTPALETRAEDAMARLLGRRFSTIVRSREHLASVLDTDPYAAHGIPADAKRVVTFLRTPRPPRVPLPLARDAASVFCMVGGEVFSAYLPTDKGPVFMQLVERAFGAEATTRTWATVARCAAA